MIRQLRLFSGLVMLAYVTMHLLNHALGLISLEAMDAVLSYVIRIWGNPVRDQITERTTLPRSSAIPTATKSKLSATRPG